MALLEVAKNNYNSALIKELERYFDSCTKLGTKGNSIVYEVEKKGKTEAYAIVDVYATALRTNNVKVTDCIGVVKKKQHEQASKERRANMDEDVSKRSTGTKAKGKADGTVREDKGE